MLLGVCSTFPLPFLELRLTPRPRPAPPRPRPPRSLQRVRWDAIEQPGDDSAFVLTMRKTLLDSAPRLGAELEEASFSFFCDKMARMFVPHFQEHLYRLRK